MQPWLFHPEIPPPGEAVILDPREARHARGARRLGPGSDIVLFDGAGRVAEATITDDGGRRQPVAARVDARRDVARPAPRITLIAALPKGDRQSIMISMCTQLGMSIFQPLSCERSIAAPSPAGFERWRRIAIEACKQSRSAWAPTLLETINLDEVEVPEGATLLVAHPGGGPLRESLTSRGDLILVVGPEGGFTDDEVRGLQQRGAAAATLGDSILRIETAAVAMLAIARDLCRQREP